MAESHTIGAFAVAAVAMTVAVTAMAQDPSSPQGRPPLLPLVRGNPRVYDVQYSVTLLFNSGTDGRPDMLHLEQHAIELPLITSDSLSQVDVMSPKCQATLLGDTGGSQVAQVPIRAESLPGSVPVLVADCGKFTGQHTRFDLSWRQQVWECELDETAAATIAWPREWPAEAASALKPEPFIECDAPAFAEFIQEVTQGQSPRSIPVQSAAKEIIKAAIALFRNVDSEGVVGERGQFRGFSLQGALAAATAGAGSRHDLVCVCGAALRAGGVPARPVVGILEETGKNAKTRLTSWGEYFLPGSGWIQFDPLAMRGSGVRNWPVNRDWKHHGEVDFDDGIRLPIAHSFLPPGDTQAPISAPAIWGWRAAGGIDPNGGVFDSVRVQVISRGKGTPD